MYDCTSTVLAQTFCVGLYGISWPISLSFFFFCPKKRTKQKRNLLALILQLSRPGLGPANIRSKGRHRVQHWQQQPTTSRSSHWPARFGCDRSWSARDLRWSQASRLDIANIAQLPLHACGACICCWTAGLRGLRTRRLRSSVGTVVGAGGILCFSSVSFDFPWQRCTLLLRSALSVVTKKLYRAISRVSPGSFSILSSIEYVGN